MAILIDELLSPQNLIEYTKMHPVPTEGLGNLFPTRTIDGLEADFIKGAYNLPVAAQIYAFDTPTKLGQREGYESGNLSLAYIKEKMKLDEKEIMNLSHPRSDAEAQYIIRNIYNDVEKVRQRIETRVEQLRWEALTTGKIDIKNENGYTASVDFGMPADHKETFTWNDDADILEDLFKVQQKIQEDTGFQITHILTSRKWLYKMTKNAAIHLAINGDNNKSKFITPGELNANLSAFGLPTVSINETQYATQKMVKGKLVRTNVNYLPDDMFIGLPDGTLGETVRGTTPERESDLVKNIATVESGEITLTHYAEVDPVAHYVKGSATAMPTFPYADQVFIGTLKES